MNQTNDVSASPSEESPPAIGGAGETKSTTKYYYMEGNEKRGPFSLEDMRGQPITHDTLIWRSGLAKWVKASTETNLANILCDSPPALPESFVSARGESDSLETQIFHPALPDILQMICRYGLLVNPAIWFVVTAMVLSRPTVANVIFRGIGAVIMGIFFVGAKRLGSLQSSGIHYIITATSLVAKACGFVVGVLLFMILLEVARGEFHAIPVPELSEVQKGIFLLMGASCAVDIIVFFYLWARKQTLIAQIDALAANAGKGGK